MAYSMIRALKFLLLFLLICASVFLASFNLTLRHLIDQRRSAAALASERASDHEILSAEDEVEQVREHIRENPDASPGEFEPDPDGWKTRLPMTEEDHRVIRNQRFRAFEADERSDPTMGRYRTTTRPQDGYREAVARDDVGHPVKFKDRPEITSHGTGRAGEKGVPDATSGGTAAEAHFAQGLRMLSSRFDRMDGKGDALPPSLGSGEYRQADIGDGFVKVRPAKRRRNKRDRQYKSKSRHAEMFVEGMAGAEEQNDKLGSGGDFESFLGDFKAIARDKYDEWHDWILEVLGGDDDRPEEPDGGTLTLSGGKQHYYDSRLSEERNEEDVFSLRDTKMGGQILWLCETVAGLWSRDGDDDGIGGDAADGNGTVSPGLSRQDVLAREGMRHLSMAAELGHPAAQRMVANSLASGILPLSDHGMIVRAAREERRKRREGRGGPAPENGGVGEDPARPTDPPLLPTTKRLDVPDDFSSGGEQLSRAVVLWHMSAMSGDVESAMALGWRHMYSASGGDTSNSILQSADQISGGYDVSTGAALPHRGNGRASGGRHYGVLGTCQTALAYYEAAAHGVMDELESGPTRGKISPPLDGHRLAEIYLNGGASVALSGNNKPDEVEEALQYYRMLASRSRSPEPDVMAAFTIANFYYFGLRGAKQDLRLAVKYYEIAGDYNHWEGGGRAGLMHVWGIGMTPDERDLGLAYKYFLQGTPGGLDNCLDRLRRKRQQAGKQDQTGPRRFPRATPAAPTGWDCSTYSACRTS
ncbi:hypothetical protein THAOC_37272 [Thalassiosira oceanica]|uniref:Uncharacterized protein n=1 Tax=Thalassiosira oceanica TaxID=159749 RepID=K0RCL3_THAOC|nr:hypothetical protein THAOC_37272 [Thalassiosira oceanica]|eukprot:EJK44212.1 hypothetical protein THAOC_37272 [Thalassiosira oceanica]